MTRLRGWRWLAGGPTKAALAVLAAVVVLAAGADFLAAERPILLRKAGRLYWLSNVVDYADLRDSDNTRLADELGIGEWALYPLCRFGPYQTGGRSLEPPSRRHWLGTDDTGRDVFARLVHGARVSLSVGVVAVAISLLIGITLGTLAGYLGGTADALIGRLIEVLVAFPSFFLLLLMQGLLERTTVLSTMVIIGLLRWTDVARLVRAEVLVSLESDHVLAARAIGQRPQGILWRHVLPFALTPVTVSASLGVAGAIVIESGLTFLGFGAQPPTASWGELLSQAYHNNLAWWLVVFPGLAIFLTVISLNVVGEAVRDARDPRMRAGVQS